MINVQDLMEKFCDAGARSIHRYFKVSGEGPWNMPEYFMPAFILDQLGDDITATLETNFRTLTEWNSAARERRGLATRSAERRIIQRLAGCRVDMALFERKAGSTARNEDDFLALVEFKGGWIDSAAIPGATSDRDKLLMLLSHVDTCPWGIVCGWAPESHAQWQKGRIKETNDSWYETRVDLPKIDKSLFFCARLFETDQDRLQQLLQALPDQYLLVDEAQR